MVVVLMVVLMVLILWLVRAWVNESVDASDFSFGFDPN